MTEVARPEWHRAGHSLRRPAPRARPLIPAKAGISFFFCPSQPEAVGFQLSLE